MYNLIVSIVPHDCGELLTNVAKEAGAGGGTIIMGRGTASNGIIQLLGLGDTSKDIVLILVDEPQKEKVLNKKRIRDVPEEDRNNIENSNQRNLRKRTERKNLNLNYIFREEVDSEKKQRTKKKLIKKMKNQKVNNCNIKHNIVSISLEESEEKEE